MKELWNKAYQQISDLNQREKLLVLITGFIIVPGLIDLFLLQPLRDDRQLWTQQTQEINQRLHSFTQQQNDLMTEIKNDPAMELERRIEGINKALVSAKQALAQYTNSLIAPQQMASMLENILQERGDLELVSLQNLPVAPLFNTQDSTEQGSDKNVLKEQSNTDKDVFGLYRHGIQLVFKGNFMSTMDYLHTLEQLPWKFYWQNFNYEVQQHPSALVTLNIYTLSTSNWWIGDKDEL